jgi:hypothetical protein
MSKNDKHKNENPDCDVATKGFVKKLFRMNDRHEHYTLIDLSCTKFCAEVGWIITLAMFGLGYCLSPQNQNIPQCADIFPYAFVFSLVCTVILIDFSISFNSGTSYTYGNFSDKIKKFRPPVKECEED